MPAGRIRLPGDRQRPWLVLPGWPGGGIIPGAGRWHL